MVNTIKGTSTLNGLRNASTNGLSTISINANGQMSYSNDQTNSMLIYSNGIKSASGKFFKII